MLCATQGTAILVKMMRPLICSLIAALLPSVMPGEALAVKSDGGVKTFRDCPDCPEMVVIPGGSFTMGSSAVEKSWAATHGAKLGWVADEAPQHQVKLQSFAMGKYPVTRAEYAAFARQSGYSPAPACAPDSFTQKTQPGISWQSPGFTQTERDPVICVSWQDANAYVSWLNQRVRPGSSTDGPYRLPSEAQWEYAARAGTTTYFWWGDDDAAASSHAWYKDNSGGATRPVGLKPPNAFGLYDMVGNVWQWTEDCYAANYATASPEGRPNESANDCLRVDRGGSWLYPAWLLRSATRERNSAKFRDIIMGFRVARSLS